MPPSSRQIARREARVGAGPAAGASQAAKERGQQTKRALAAKGHDAQQAALSPGAGLLSPASAKEALAYNHRHQRRQKPWWVKALQAFLGVPTSGTYDEATVQEVASFQDGVGGLTVDGKVGRNTKRALHGKLEAPKKDAPAEGGPATASNPKAPLATPGPVKAANAEAQTADKQGAEASDAAPPEVATVLARVQALIGQSAPTISLAEDKLELAPMSAWLAVVEPVFKDAVAAFDALPDDAAERQELGCAMEDATFTAAQSLEANGKAIRDHAVQLLNSSSLMNKDAKQPTLPTQAEARCYQEALRALGGHSATAATGAAGASLSAAVATAQDGALAIFQGLSVLAARATWQGGVKEPKADDAGKRPKGDPLRKIFKDAGWSSKVTTNSAKTKVSDWCGMFVGAHLYRGGGLDEELRAGMFHTSNVLDYFQYQQKTNAKRAPKSIWADGSWHDLKTYHGTRGSQRRWTTRAAITTAMENKSPLDIRPGDVVLIDHSGLKKSPQHITMVESYDPATQTLVTIEGNTGGIQSADKPVKDAQGVAHPRKHRGPDGAGLHTRDMTAMSAASAAAWDTVHKDKDKATKAKPKGAYLGRRGATIFGVGRPSVVDFEEHSYATRAVPQKLRSLSPTEMRALAKKQTSDGAQARRVGAKKER
ncbi:MAG: hypothetical protein CSA66_06790 [Proteobacteria bacterium]|nr:MAG: hypothetical protein CSA66_06790 [Pseudomonadota bacterium]